MEANAGRNLRLLAPVERDYFTVMNVPESLRALASGRQDIERVVVASAPHGEDRTPPQ